MPQSVSANPVTYYSRFYALCVVIREFEKPMLSTYRVLMKTSCHLITCWHGLEKTSRKPNRNKKRREGIKIPLTNGDKTLRNVEATASMFLAL